MPGAISSNNPGFGVKTTMDVKYGFCSPPNPFADAIGLSTKNPNASPGETPAQLNPFENL
ncbi:MAG: hypothetical protein LBJ71_01590 [Holosporaceae bacterium]|nr:hypothetical protein [Holosporaceae bacterium]